jgi:hypothetical protein
MFWNRCDMRGPAPSRSRSLLELIHSMGACIRDGRQFFQPAQCTAVPRMQSLVKVAKDCCLRQR